MENKNNGGGLGCKVRDVGAPRMEALPQGLTSGRLHGGGGVELGRVGWGRQGRRHFRQKEPCKQRCGNRKAWQVESTSVWRDPKAQEGVGSKKC